MSSSVLSDLPGPRSVRRHRLYNLAAAVVVAGIAAWVVSVLASKGQLDSVKWEYLSDAGTWRAIGRGLLNTLKVAAVAVTLALAFGTVFAVLRLSDRAWLRWPATAVIEFFRAVPLLLLILFVFLGYGDRIGRFWALVLALMLYNGAVLAEIFRAGIASVPKGQSEAAYAVGLRKAQVMRLVLIPQAVRVMLPAIISQCVVALKDSTLGVIISYPELVSMGAKDVYVFYNNPLQAGLVVAAIFIVLNYSLSKLAVVLEGRQRRQRRGPKAPDVTKIETGMGQASV
jgi:glutamate transport system permease protein